VTDAIEKAKKFLGKEQAFRLGELPTESFHPKTKTLSETARSDLTVGIRLLQSVDEDIPPVAEKVLAQENFNDLVKMFVNAMKAEKRIYFTGCGATGRLSILLEAAWRRFWHQLKQKHPDISKQISEMGGRIISIMAGGDYALIKAVEGFEDFTDFGRYQLKQAGVTRDDVVVAITEGGETPFVIGTAWQGLDSGAKVFFVYNNPTNILCRCVQRSRKVIEEPRIRKLDLATGPMAITGSTRMQAVTIELLIVGGALELALMQFLQECLSLSLLKKLGLCVRPIMEYHQLFLNLLNQLSNSMAVNTMARVVEFEENIYKQGGLITYMTDSAMLDVLTDTTERSPTFMVPPFRKEGDSRSPQSWAFVKNPFQPTEKAWCDMLQREPRGLEWDSDVYKRLNALAVLHEGLPRLDNNEIYKFRIGNEPDPSRTNTVDSALVVISVGTQMDYLIRNSLERFGSKYKKTAVMTVGPAVAVSDTNELFQFRCDLPCSPLQLWHHLAVKLILNTISTATMVRMGRVIGNAMVWLSPSCKKLIDRGSRLISQQTGCSYEQACITLHQTMEEVQSRLQQGRETPSPVALAIEQISTKHGKS
jgi:N-acetylmuramic acid 6-phosphate etherase